jgi:hypothetical protein
MRVSSSPFSQTPQGRKLLGLVSLPLSQTSYALKHVQRLL